MILRVITLLLVWSCSASAADIDEILASAKAGDVESQNQLGFLYSEGTTLPKDEGQAVYWLEKAASSGYPKAQTNLGYMYEKGLGVPRDQQLAVSWYTKAALQGASYAQMLLARHYDTGQGVPLDKDQAVAWYIKAAEQDAVEAQYRLGVLYSAETFADDDLGAFWSHVSKGMPRDDVKAAAWLRRAAGHGHAKAQYRLAIIIGNGIGVAKDQKAAVELLRKSAKSDYVGACYRLGLFYEKGMWGVIKDDIQAAFWYQRAVDQYVSPLAPNADRSDRSSSAYALGKMYQEGRGGLKSDMYRAVLLYSKSADDNLVNAKADLATFFGKPTTAREELTDSIRAMTPQ